MDFKRIEALFNKLSPQEKQSFTAWVEGFFRGVEESAKYQALPPGTIIKERNEND